MNEWKKEIKTFTRPSTFAEQSAYIHSESLAFFVVELKLRVREMKGIPCTRRLATDREKKQTTKNQINWNALTSDVRTKRYHECQSVEASFMNLNETNVTKPFREALRFYILHSTESFLWLISGQLAVHLRNDLSVIRKQLVGLSGMS